MVNFMTAETWARDTSKSNFEERPQLCHLPDYESIDLGTSSGDLPGESILGIEIATLILWDDSWNWVVPEMT